MKKLIMTTVAAFGFAVCAKAADDGVLNKTGFEDYGDKDFAVNATDTGATVGDQFWTGDGSADFTQTVLKTYAAEIEKPANVPDAFTNAANTTFLSVDTGSAVMYRRAAANPTETINLSSAGPVFFDADVKFTASETPVVPSEGDKLLVWLKGDETTTNLVVTAGILDDRGVVTNTESFVTGADVEADTWYRLTVKAGVDDKNCTYFNVYIDGNLVSSDETTTFYSLVQSGSARYTIAEAGFQGTGALDNVVWTTTDPFPPVVVDEFTARVTLEQVPLSDGYDLVDAWALEGEEKTGDSAATATVAVGDDAKFVVRMVCSLDVTVTATIDGVQVDQANIVKTDGEGDEEGASVYTITIDGSKYGDDETAALVITITENGSGDEPEDTTEINADGTGYVADEDGSTYTKAEVEAMVTVVAPNAASLSDEAKEAYDGYFTKNATYNTETKKWEVAVTLDTDTLEADVDDAVEAALEAVVGDAETKAVEIPAGFYYKIEHGATVGLTGEPLTGTSTGSVAMPVLGKDAGFFKVSVGTTDFAE